LVARYNGNEGVAISIATPMLPAHKQAPARALARKQHLLSRQELQLLADLSKLAA
jgi:hypothetical protein